MDSKTIINYVVTHQTIPWSIPFKHKLVTVGNYREVGAINSSDFMSPDLALDRTIAFFRFIPAVLHDLESYPDFTPVAVMNHRTFFNKHLVRGLSRPVCENDFRSVITPTAFSERWGDICLSQFPGDIDIIVTNPIDLGAPVIAQYANVHHIDDLLLGMGLAVRMGLIKESAVKIFLLRPHAINWVIAPKNICVEIFLGLWNFCQTFFWEYYKRRDGYQERAVNFVVERLAWAMFLIAASKAHKLGRCATTKIFTVSEEGTYRRGI